MKVVSQGDLKTRYPGASLTLRLPSPEDGGTRLAAFVPTHRVETRLPDRRTIVDYVRLLRPGLDDLIDVNLDTDFWAAATPNDYTILAHGYSVVKTPTYGYSHRSKEWWPFICPEPAWTSARISTVDVRFEPVEERSDYVGSPPLQLSGDGVYFAQARTGGPVKIGFSTDARRRQADLQTAQPEQLVYLAFIPGTMADEKALHTRFSDARLEGEWFEETPVVDWLRRRGYIR